MKPAPFLRGNPWAGVPRVPYPRANPGDADRLPRDTWAQSRIPACVRLEFEGDAGAIEISYVTNTDDLGYRGEGAGHSFDLWRDGGRVSMEPAVLGSGTVRLEAGTGGRAVVYLPEGMKPEILDVSTVDGSIEPAAPQPRWVAYGDSILEGWIASGPASGWGAIVSREHNLDIQNLGYAGAARGEVVSAEHVSVLEADVVSITHGTNCWTRIPHSVGLMRETTRAFLEVVRQGHPSVPILVCSPIIRPDGENTPNGLGATLADLRKVMEDVATEREDVTVIEGLPIVDASQLGDGIHPDDAGHRAIADVLGPKLAELVA